MLHSRAGVKPVPTDKYGDITLTKNTDYKISYSNNTVLSGNSKKIPAVKITVKDDGKKLSAGKDYVKAIEYIYVSIPEGAKILDGSSKKMPEIERHAGDTVGSKDVVPAGTEIKAVITALGKYYKDSTFVTYRVIAQDINKLKITVKSKEYTGQAVTLTSEDFTFKSNKQGDVTFNILEDTYSNNVKTGKATVVIEGTGNYGGRKTVTYNIGVKKILWWLIR